MAPVNKNTIVEEIANNISTSYGIEPAIVNDFKVMMMNALAEYYVYDSDQGKKGKGAKAGKGAAKAAADADKGPKKLRKTSSYNVYVKKMMQADEVKTVPQKEKMSLIGKMWAALSADQKQVYQGLADAENAANPALNADSVTESTL